MDNSITPTPSFNYVQQIAEALKNKSKRTAKYKMNWIEKQSQFFSASYRDFVLKIISNNSLKILFDGIGGYLEHPDEDFDTQSKPTKKSKNKIVVDIHDADILPHELGHAVDMWCGEKFALSKTVIIKDNKTLYDILSEEFESKHQELYELVINEYKNIIDSELGSGSYQIIKNNMGKYLELHTIHIYHKDEVGTLKRRNLQKELYKSNFVELYYQLYIKKCNEKLNVKYSPILDALSSTYDLNGWMLDHHEKGYYRSKKCRLVYEFFANVFAAKITSNFDALKSLIKLLPNSFDAFEKLFVIAYDHIQNNLKFSDINFIK